ncbi:MAG: hypothetical protein ACI4JA_04185 [Oscillospiraceae bacterium]
MEILTLLRANIRHKKGAFVSVILLMMMITLSFSVTVSNNDNVSDGIERAHTTADTGDLAAFIDESKLDDDMLKSLSENENVKRIRDQKSMAFLSYKIGEREGKNPFFLLKWENSLPVFDEKLMDFQTASVPVLMICLCFFVFAFFSSGKIKRVEIRELVSE